MDRYRFEDRDTIVLIDRCDLANASLSERLLSEEILRLAGREMSALLNDRCRIREAVEEWVSQEGVNHEGYPGADKITLINADDLLGALDLLLFPEGEAP